MAESTDNEIAVWNLSLHRNLCNRIINTLRDWLYDHTIRDDDHTPTHYHATVHIETEGAQRGTLWADWHCQHCLIIYRYATVFVDTYNNLHAQMRALDTSGNIQEQENRTELVDLLSPPFHPIAGGTIAEILRQFTEQQHSPTSESESIGPSPERNIQINGSTLADITNLIPQT